MRLKGSYVWKLGVAGSVVINALLNGEPPETLCCRAARAARAGRRWGCIFCRLIDRLDPGHCDRELAFWERLQ